MKQNKLRITIAAVLGVLAVVLIVLGAMNMPQRTGEKGEQIISDLRNRTLLIATGDGVVESYVAIAKKEATAAAKAAGGGMSAIREAVAKAEEEKAKGILKTLFETCLHAPEKLRAAGLRQIPFADEREVCDYIAGMTDNYAIYVFKTLFLPQGWQVRR